MVRFFHIMQRNHIITIIIILIKCFSLFSENTMAIVASVSTFQMNNMPLRIKKKKKIRINPPDFSNSANWLYNSVVPNRLEELSKRQWEKEVRRISLSSLPQVRSMEDKISKSDGCLACTTNRVNPRGSCPTVSLRKAVLSKQAHSADEDSPRRFSGIADARDSSHNHSDLCLRNCPRRKLSREEQEHLQNIEIVSSHSSLKCGTNIKAWTIKLDIRPFTPEGEVVVTADGHMVKLKVKYGQKRKGIDRVFGTGQKEVKRTLKFAGDVEAASLKTVTEKEGYLVIDLWESLPY